MARPRIQFKIDKGRPGTSLVRIKNLSACAVKFLGELSRNTGLDNPEEGWVVPEVYNQSHGYTPTYAGNFSTAQAERFLALSAKVCGFDPETQAISGNDPIGLIRVFAEFSKILEDQDVLEVGVFNSRDIPVNTFEWTSHRFSRLNGMLAVEPLVSTSGLPMEGLDYLGSALGYVTQLFPDSPLTPRQQAHFWLKVQTGEQVKCFYSTEQLDKVRNGIGKFIMVSGLLHTDSQAAYIEWMKVDDIEVLSTLSEQEAQKFFGVDPDFTGDMSTKDYISMIRRYNDHS